MIFSTEPAHYHAYSQRTADKPVSMPNVWSIPKKAKCHFCGKHRTEVTGKYTARGNFKCAECRK